MIDTTIEIRSSDKKWLLFALQSLITKLELNIEKDVGGMLAHHYDVSYTITKVKEIA
jgi:hypothetical protein